MLGGLLIWLSSQVSEDPHPASVPQRCVLPTDFAYLEQQLAVCAEFIRLQPDNPDGYMDRGLIFLDLGAFDYAAADFSQAHSLDRANPWALANLGVASAWKKDKAGARRAFDAVRSVDPSNPAMLRGEAILKQQEGDIAAAVDFLSRSMVRDPDNLWALRTRSELYWELGEHEKSAEDDSCWVELKKKNRSNEQAARQQGMP